MRTLLGVTIAAIALTAVLTGVLLHTTSDSRGALETMTLLQEQQSHAQDVRTEMLIMGDAMRGFLLDPTRKDEWDRKMAADEALARAVEKLVPLVHDPKLRELAASIGTFDEQKLNPAENRVLDAAKVNAADGGRLYFREYAPLRTEQLARVEALVDGIRDSARRTADAETASLATLGTRVAWGGGAALLLCLVAGAWAFRASQVLSRRIAGSVEVLSDGMREVTAAASQVSTAAQGLSKDSSEQAASLEETSASMEEMASMTRRNAENSQRASTLMGQTGKLVEQAHGALGQMVASM